MVFLETFTETHPVKWMTIRLAFFQPNVAFDCSYIEGTSVLISSTFLHACGEDSHGIVVPGGPNDLGEFPWCGLMFCRLLSSP